MKTTSSAITTLNSSGNTHRHFARTAMTVLALAAGCAGFLAGSGAASADGPVRAPTTLTSTKVTTNAPKATALKPGSPLGGKMVAINTVAKLVDAGATGDGPADQEECDSWANGMNALLDQFSKSKNVAERVMLLEAVSLNADGAEDRGCFVVYT